MRISLNGSDWLIQGWIPQEWELVGVRQIVTANLDIGKMLNAETGLLPATVPGCVQADLLRNGIIDDPYVDLNSRQCEWAAHRNWLYQKSFHLPAEAEGRKLRLIFHGIDHSARVWLNGQLLGRHSGTFIPAEFDVTGLARTGTENHLVLMFDPAPDVPAQVGYSNAVRHLKPRFAYKWDFTTRLVQIGLWDDVEVAVTGPVHIDNVWVRPYRSQQPGSANLHVRLVSAEEAELRVNAKLMLGGEVVAEKQLPTAVGRGESALDIELDPGALELWWPNGLGEQPLYAAVVSLAGPDGDEWDRCSVNFGLREIEVVQNEGAPRDADPYTMVVNGRKVFLKGWNFVPVDHMYGLANTGKYEWLVDLARRANVNILRVWGGGIIEKEIFYELCDRAGILVWQEMPQSSSGLSNEPPTDPDFLRTLKATAVSALRRRRNHPCLVIWGAGNELAEGLKPLSLTHPNLAAVGEAVREEAPHLIYRPTSPYGPAYDPIPENFGKGLHHDVHGPWKYQGVRGQYDLFNANDCLFHAEAGAEGCAGVASIRRCLRKEKPWPADRTNRAWVHHAGWWANADFIREHFGELRSLGDFVMASQFVQAEALRYAVESNRRRKFRCSASLLWQMNEPWPNVSATTCVDYYGLPKPAYYFVARAFRPRHISLKYSRLDQAPGEPFDAEMFVHNSLDAPGDAEASCRIFDAAGALLAEESRRLELPENSCISAGKIQWRVPPGIELFIVRLELTVDDGTAAPNEYVFPVPAAGPVLAPLANLPMTTVDLDASKRTEQGAVVRAANKGDAVALMTMIEPDDWTKLYVEGNVRMLLPGEVAEFALFMRRPDGPGMPQPHATLTAWNSVPLVFNV